MAIVPPPNASGILPPPNPEDAIAYEDIASARKLESTRANPAPQTPGPADVAGRAEAYRSSLVFDQGPAAPAWLQELTASINTMQEAINTLQGDVARLLQKSNEQPIILANSHAGNREPLYDPTQLQGNWAAPLARPEHRDDLLTMSGQDCIAAATALGLPPLPADTTVEERRRQIARRIGVRFD